jgi:hypothetical protein
MYFVEFISRQVFYPMCTKRLLCPRTESVQRDFLITSRFLPPSSSFIIGLNEATTKRVARPETMKTSLQEEETRNQADDGVQAGGWLGGLWRPAARPRKHSSCCGFFDLAPSLGDSMGEVLMSDSNRENACYSRDAIANGDKFTRKRPQIIGCAPPPPCGSDPNSGDGIGLGALSQFVRGSSKRAKAGSSCSSDHRCTRLSTTSNKEWHALPAPRVRYHPATIISPRHLKIQASSQPATY